MNDYIKSLSAVLPKDNPGYEYICSDYVFIPIQKTQLSIIKRSVQDLRFVDEMILKFIEKGVCHIQEIAAVMGLPEDILDISLTDLIRYDYITITSKICRLEQKGVRFIKGEMATVKERVDLPNIYINLCTGDFIDTGDNLVSNYYSHAYKFKHNFVADINFFKKKISMLKEIFIERKPRMPTSSPSRSKNGEVSDEELFSVEKVKDAFCLFKKVKLNFYVSETNQVIDITAVSSGDAELVTKLKNEIITKIANKEVLKNLISTKKRHLDSDDAIQYEYPLELRNLIKSFSVSRDRDSIVMRIDELIYSSRELIENELQPIVDHISKSAKMVDIFLGNNLSFRAKEPELISLLQIASSVGRLRIYYNTDTDFDKGANIITRSVQHIKKGHFHKKAFTEDFKIVFDNKQNICSLPMQVPIYNSLYLNYNKYYMTIT